MWLLIGLVGIALAFDFMNGRNDAANSIATIVSTRVLAPRYAVAWAAFFNFVAFLVFGLHVANTIGTGIVQASTITDQVVFGALVGAICWQVLTGYLGIPSSSSHALIGGLVGAGVAHSGIHVIVWKGLGKTIAAIVLSPMTGFILALLLVLLVSWACVRQTPSRVDGIFRKVQFVSASLYSLGHGGNDAQKTMGIIAALLAAHGQLSGAFHVPFWVVIACNGAMALGTLLGPDAAHCAYYGPANHPADTASGRVRGDGRIDHLVLGNLARHSGFDHPHDHGRRRRRGCGQAGFGRALERGARDCYRLGDYNAGGSPDGRCVLRPRKAVCVRCIA